MVYFVEVLGTAFSFILSFINYFIYELILINFIFFVTEVFTQITGIKEK